MGRRIFVPYVSWIGREKRDWGLLDPRAVHEIESPRVRMRVKGPRYSPIVQSKIRTKSFD